jgi:hypothetical protein
MAALGEPESDIIGFAQDEDPQFIQFQDGVPRRS